MCRHWGLPLRTFKRKTLGTENIGDRPFVGVIGMEMLSPARGADMLARDPRLVNGQIVGGIGFVREMTGRLSAKFRGSPTLRMVGRFGKESLYASHGGRSAPRRVA